MVASVDLAHPQVGGVYRTGDAAPRGVGVGGGAGEHGPVQLVLEDEEDVLEGVHADVPARHPLGRDVEVGSNAVPEDGCPHLPRTFAPFRLVRLSRVRVRPVYSVAVGVNEGVVRCVPARVYGRVHVRTVLPAPGGAAKRVKVGEVVMVDVVHWKVVVAEPLEDLADGLHDGDVAKIRKLGPPLSERGRSFLGRFYPFVSREGEEVTHLPRGARAQAYSQAHDIRRLLVF